MRKIVSLLLSIVFLFSVVGNAFATVTLEETVETPEESIAALEAGQSYEIINPTSASDYLKLTLGSNKYDIVVYRSNGTIQQTNENYIVTSISIPSGGKAHITMKAVNTSDVGYAIPVGFSIQKTVEQAVTLKRMEAQEVYKIKNIGTSTQTFYLKGNASGVENVTIFKSTGEQYSSYNNWNSSVSVPAGGYAHIKVGDRSGLYFYYPAQFNGTFTVTPVIDGVNPFSLLESGKSYVITNESTESADVFLDLALADQNIYDLLINRANGSVLMAREGWGVATFPVPPGGKAHITLKDKFSVNAVLPDGFVIVEVAEKAIDKKSALLGDVYRINNTSLTKEETVYIKGIYTFQQIKNVTTYKATGEVYAAYDNTSNPIFIPAGGYAIASIGDSEGIHFYYPAVSSENLTFEHLGNLFINKVLDDLVTQNPLQNLKLTEHTIVETDKETIMTLTLEDSIKDLTFIYEIRGTDGYGGFETKELLEGESLVKQEKYLNQNGSLQLTLVSSGTGWIPPAPVLKTIEVDTTIDTSPVEQVISGGISMIQTGVDMYLTLFLGAIGLPTVINNFPEYPKLQRALQVLTTAESVFNTYNGGNLIPFDDTDETIISFIKHWIDIEIREAYKPEIEAVTPEEPVNTNDLDDTSYYSLAMSYFLLGINTMNEMLDSLGDPVGPTGEEELDYYKVKQESYYQDLLN